MNGATVPEIADVCDVHKRTAGREVAQLVRDGVIYTALIAREGRGVHTIFTTRPKPKRPGSSGTTR